MQYCLCIVYGHLKCATFLACCLVTRKLKLVVMHLQPLVPVESWAAAMVLCSLQSKRQETFNLRFAITATYTQLQNWQLQAGPCMCCLHADFVA